MAQIDWAIVGGESGPRARPMSIESVDEVEDLCRFYGTAFFFKQWGGRDKKLRAVLLMVRFMIDATAACFLSIQLTPFLISPITASDDAI